MDEKKKERSESKKPSRSDKVKRVISNYLSARQYPISKPGRISKKRYLQNVVLDSKIRRSNSVLFRCYDTDRTPACCDIVLIKQTFSKFLLWMKELCDREERYCDLEILEGPLFCHLYLDLLCREQSDEAKLFFYAYVETLNKSKLDGLVKEIINTSVDDAKFGKLRDKFRSHRYVIDLEPETLKILKKYISEECHVLLLQILQRWFHFNTDKEYMDNEQEHSASSSSKEDQDNSMKFDKLRKAIEALQKVPTPIYNIRVSHVDNPVQCGFLKRQAGIIAFAQKNILKVVPINTMNSMFAFTEPFREIQANNHSRRIYSITLSNDNILLATSSADGSICIYNTATFSLFKRVYGHLGPVYCIKISENGKYLASGSQDCTARLWSLKTGRTLRIFAGHSMAVTCLDFHPNTLYLATGSSDKNVRVWSTKTASPVRLMHSAKGPIYAVAHNKGGQYLASASGDEIITIWDLTTAKVLVEVKTTGSVVTKLCWSNNGQQLCGCSTNGIVKVWDVSNFKEDNKTGEPPIIMAAKNDAQIILFVEFSLGTFSTLTT